MEYKILNIFFCFILITYSIRTIYFTYKEPSLSISTNFKGYLSSISLLSICIISIVGRFDLLQTIIEIFKNTFKIKTDFKIYVIIGWILFLFIGIAIYYYFKNNKKSLIKTGELSRTKYIVNSALIYLSILFVITFLIIKIFNSK